VTATTPEDLWQNFSDGLVLFLQAGRVYEGNLDARTVRNEPTNSQKITPFLKFESDRFGSRRTEFRHRRDIGISVAIPTSNHKNGASVPNTFSTAVVSPVITWSTGSPYTS
jgi:hypothetical protein